jgi:hypothetical protein
MTVGLLQYKRDETVEVIEPWLTTPSFTLLQGAVLCGKLEITSNCNRWIRPYFFSVQNTIRAALTTKWKKIQGYYTRMGISKVKAKYGLPKNLERLLLPLIVRYKALLLWHSKATFAIPAEVKQDLALTQGWLHDPTGLYATQPLSLRVTPAKLLEGPSLKNSCSGLTFTGQHGSDTAANCGRLTPAISISIA